MFDKYDVPYELMPTYLNEISSPSPSPIESSIGISSDGVVVIDQPHLDSQTSVEISSEVVNVQSPQSEPPVPIAEKTELPGTRPPRMRETAVT